jgi:transposase InsO family protein
MRRTLKADATKPAGAKVLHPQARFDAFIARYNHQRPHQALGMRVPGDLAALLLRWRNIVVRDPQ